MNQNYQGIGWHWTQNPFSAHRYCFHKETSEAMKKSFSEWMIAIDKREWSFMITIDCDGRLSEYKAKRIMSAFKYAYKNKYQNLMPTGFFAFEPFRQDYYFKVHAIISAPESETELLYLFEKVIKELITNNDTWFFGQVNINIFDPRKPNPSSYFSDNYLDAVDLYYDRF